MAEDAAPRQNLHRVTTRSQYNCLYVPSSSAKTLIKQSSLSVFRLIDVQHACVVELADVDLSSLEYATLSYVWGRITRLTLQTQNRLDLQKRGSLDKSVGNTIWDAMQFTNLLEIRYLWVDALCIIQNDDADKAMQIGGMGAIYSNSHLTIIAAAGRDADAGLPGITNPRTSTQNEIPIPGLDNGGVPAGLLTMLNPRSRDIRHSSEDSYWASRGWTFQERVLSKRAIYFLEEQILWDCGQLHRVEETHSEMPLARFSYRQFQTSPHSATPFGDIPSFMLREMKDGFVNAFTSRSLTKPGDAYDAFAAVLQQMQKHSGSQYLWGLPSTTFELALLWYHKSTARRRTCLTTLPITSLKRKVAFPSWSWFGWEGAVSSPGIEPIRA